MENMLLGLYCCDSQLCGVDNIGLPGFDPNVDFLINVCSSLGFEPIRDPGPPPATHLFVFAKDLLLHYVFADNGQCKSDNHGQFSFDDGENHNFDVRGEYNFDDNPEFNIGYRFLGQHNSYKYCHDEYQWNCSRTTPNILSGGSAANGEHLRTQRRCPRRVIDNGKDNHCCGRRRRDTGGNYCCPLALPISQKEQRARTVHGERTKPDPSAVNFSHFSVRVSIPILSGA
ncbi:hypothetical protein LMH87_011068 [Akanthomyces muscarius]|uniref:Uncharacterized protein n=1 Tax=Akanthomyces muscarius TaxID=2231603 RepID=A0A9W8Q8F8_AKAMU|nr:hypothetical protein LMH87_011068 [Akanthomyces muscarius]KAJ4150314.1 hypothetical protein LMH87_011068 [Akanthomyces muscarius]